MSRRASTQQDIQRERARARGARRLLPWSVLTAAGGAALGVAAGGGVRAAATLLAIGLSFALFLWVMSIPRCPVCGARLPLRPERLERCARCGTRFDEPPGGGRVADRSR